MDNIKMELTERLVTVTYQMYEIWGSRNNVYEDFYNCKKFGKLVESHNNIKCKVLYITFLSAS